MLYQVDVGYACGGIVMDGDRCVDTAPIFGWMRGKNRTEIRRWLKKKGAKVKEV